MLGLAQLACVVSVQVPAEAQQAPELWARAGWVKAARASRNIVPATRNDRRQLETAPGSEMRLGTTGMERMHPP